MRPRLLVLLVVGLLLALAACATRAGSDAAVGAEPASNVAAVDLDFTATTLDGSAFEGEQLRGKVTVLWFWAPWCPTCRAQAPAVSKLATTYGDQVNVVGVGGLADAADIREFAEQVDGPIHLVDERGEIWRHLGVSAQSTYLVLDADGDPVAEGYLDDPVLAERVAELVG